MSRYLSLSIRAAPAAKAGQRLTPARLADWCRRFTPLAATDAPDGVMLDIAGAAHLYGGEIALAVDIEQRLAAWGYTARAALADTAGAAWVLARFGEVRAAPPGGDEKTLRRLFGPMPVAALRLAPATVYGLSQTGLKRIDDLLFRPRAPITARFGAQVFVRLDGLMGRLRHPITPRFEAPPYLVERRFAEPLLQREAIERVLAGLAINLTQQLERHGEGARQIEARLYRVDGVVRRVAAAASRPLRNPAALARLLRERIAALCAQHEDPLASDYGFDVVQLTVLRAEPLQSTQPTLTPTQPALTPTPANHDSATAPNLAFAKLAPEQLHSEDLADLVDRLGARLGWRRVLRFRSNDTHIPEFAVTGVAACSPMQLHEHRRGSVSASSTSLAPNLAAPARPIRLFERPEPVEALAEVPDGPPRRFRWRRVLHEIAAMEGPERIAPEWWKAQSQALTRDYFRVEDVGGQRFWLYREGLYGAETGRPRWFMHGLFA